MFLPRFPYLRAIALSLSLFLESLHAEPGRSAIAFHIISNRPAGLTKSKCFYDIIPRQPQLGCGLGFGNGLGNSAVQQPLTGD